MSIVDTPTAGRPVVRLLAAALLVAAMLAWPAGAAAQTPAGCPFSFGFAALKAQLGPLMGNPVTCEYPDPTGTGDALQNTTTGLAFWRKATNTPTFTDGFRHWALTAAGVATWTGTSIDPPPTAPVTPLPPMYRGDPRAVAIMLSDLGPGWVLARDHTINISPGSGNYAVAYAFGLAAADAYVLSGVGESSIIVVVDVKPTTAEAIASVDSTRVPSSNDSVQTYMPPMGDASYALLYRTDGSTEFRVRAKNVYLYIRGIDEEALMAWMQVMIDRVNAQAE